MDRTYCYIGTIPDRHAALLTDGRVPIYSEFVRGAEREDAPTDVGGRGEVRRLWPLIEDRTIESGERLISPGLCDDAGFKAKWQNGGENET